MDGKNCSGETWCPSMSGRLNEANARKTGLCPLVIFNVNTGEQTLAGVVYKTKPNDNGILLNNCPWCGESFAGMRKSLEKSESD